MFRASLRCCSATAPAASTTPRALALLIDAVARRRGRPPLRPDDIFKLCVTAAGRDGAGLGLLQDTAFVTALRDGAASAAATGALSPFQLSQVKDMCTKAGVEWTDVAVTQQQPKSSSTGARRDDASGGGKAASTAASATTSAAHHPPPHVANAIPPAPAAPSAGAGKVSNLWDESTVVARAQSSSLSSSSSSSSSSVATADGEPSAQPFQVDTLIEPAGLQDIVDALFAARRSFDERGTYELRAVQGACDSLGRLVPYLSHISLLHIVRALSHINHQDFTLAQRLALRACQLANAFSLGECCRVLALLFRLKAQDSMTALVKRIERECGSLKLHDMISVISAAREQSQTTASLQPLVGQLMYQLSGRVGETQMSIVQVVMCVEVAAKFGHGQMPSAKIIVEGAARRAGELSDRNLAAVLQSAHAMNLVSPDVFARLSAQAVALAPSAMDARQLEPILDVLSLLPYNSGPFMDCVLLRLADDAGKLQPTHLVSVIELLASYPGTKGSTAVPALALAAAMRKELLDQQGVTLVLQGLAQLGQLSDEFYHLFEFLLAERKGFKNGADVVALLGHVAAPVADARFAPLVVRALGSVVASMAHADAVDLQADMKRLRIDDRAAMRRVAARLESLAAETTVASQAASQAAVRRASHHQSGGGGSSAAEIEWDMVSAQSTDRRRQQHQPHQQQQQQQQHGDPTQQQRSPQAPPFPPAPQHFEQLRPAAPGGGGRPQAPITKWGHQGNQQQQQQPQRGAASQSASKGAKKKPFDLRKAMWDDGT